MTHKKDDWYFYCDICGQRHFASEATKLTQYTGKGGLIVCNHDVDTIEYSLIPFRTPTETNPSLVRVNHTNTDNSSPTVDLETMTFQYYLAASQDNAIITASQDDAWITIGIPI